MVPFTPGSPLPALDGLHMLLASSVIHGTHSWLRTKCSLKQLSGSAACTLDIHCAAHAKQPSGLAA